MASTIKIKRSSTGGSVPASLSAGELAINTVDRKLYSSNGSSVFAVSAEPSLGNTNSYIATKVNTTTFNSALANTNTYIATKASSANPTTSGVLAHTGRATISTNLTVSGNTVIGKLVANGSLGTSGYALKTNGSTVYWDAVANANLTGDVTSVGNATTLATVNSNVGAFGGTTAIPVITVNAKGLVTAVTTSAVVAPASTLSGSTLASGVTSSSLTSLGTIATLAAGTISASGLVAAAGRITVGTNLDVSGNTTIGGNLTVSGSLTYIDSTTISLGDNMIKIANNNIGDSIDMGIYQSYTSSGKKYNGLIRDATDGVFKFFYGLVAEPNQTIDFTQTTQATIDATIDGGSY